MKATITSKKIFNFNYRIKKKAKASKQVESVNDFLKRGGKITYLPISRPGFFTLPGAGGKNVFLQTE